MTAIPEAQVVLIGARGAGKSTVAAGLGLDWVDMDMLVRDQLGFETAAEAFQQVGEPLWRRTEAHVLEALLRDGPPVIAAGGGVGCVPATASLLQQAATEGRLKIVWLRTSVAEAQRRLREALGDRPALTDAGNAVDEVPDVMDAREGHYARLAHVTIDADPEPVLVVAAVRAWLVAQA